MHCFYIDSIAPDGAVRLPKDEARHAAKVLRLKPGDEVCAMDGAGGRWKARIVQMDGEVRVELMEALDSHEPPVRLSVYQGVPKADKLDFIAQKLTELGAAALIPVKMDRCVVKPDERDGAKRAERLTRIAREAAKQCGRAVPPRVEPPMSWGKALEAMRAHQLLLVPWEEAEGMRMKDVHVRRSDANDIGIVIGPEGGMTTGEVEAMKAMGAQVVTLGPRILRTETAGVISAALAMMLWGDM